MLKTVTATAGLRDWEKEFLAIPAMVLATRQDGGVEVNTGELSEIGLPSVEGMSRGLTREEAGELAAALLQLGADDAPVRAVLKIADA